MKISPDISAKVSQYGAAIPTIPPELPEEQLSNLSKSNEKINIPNESRKSVLASGHNINVSQMQSSSRPPSISGGSIPASSYNHSRKASSSGGVMNNSIRNLPAVGANVMIFPNAAYMPTLDSSAVTVG